jgi:hypothetical protein
MLVAGGDPGTVYHASATIYGEDECVVTYYDAFGVPMYKVSGAYVDAGYELGLSIKALFGFTGGLTVLLDVASPDLVGAEIRDPQRVVTRLGPDALRITLLVNVSSGENNDLAVSTTKLPGANPWLRGSTLAGFFVASAIVGIALIRKVLRSVF